MAGCETYQENKDICKFPGDLEKIGVVEKLIPEKSESLGEGPIDREDLMRPTSSSTKSREDEKREGTDQQLQETTATASSPRDAKVWA